MVTILIAGLIGLIIGLMVGVFLIRKPETAGMTRQEIVRARQELVEIQKLDVKDRYEPLKKLARNVGAGTEHTKIVSSDTHKEGTSTTTIIRQNPISESELIHNINDALRTESMIHSYKVMIITAATSVISAIAAWVAILVKSSQ